MAQPQVFQLPSDTAEKTDIESLVRLWFAAEELRSLSSADFNEDSKLESFRDGISKQQDSIAHRLIETRATRISHVLDKLKMWESAYGPGINATLETSGDTYTYMVLSAMQDLRALMPS